MTELSPNDFLLALNEIKRILALDPKLKPLVRFYINKDNADEIETQEQKATTELPVQSEGLVQSGTTSENDSSSEILPGEPA